MVEQAVCLSHVHMYTHVHVNPPHISRTIISSHIITLTIHVHPPVYTMYICTHSPEMETDVNAELDFTEALKLEG